MGCSHARAGGFEDKPATAPFRADGWQRLRAVPEGWQPLEIDA